MKNKKKLPEIIVPTAFIGGTKPNEAKYGDIWIKDMGNKYDFFVYLDKWFPVINAKETKYTDEQKLTIKKYEEDYKSEQNKKIEKYENIFKNLKEVLECMN